MIPIIRAQNTARLDPKGAAAPILSLVLQLAQAEQLNLVQDKSPFFTGLWSNLKQNLQNLIDQLLQKQQIKTSSPVEVSSQAIQVKSRQQSNHQLVKNLSQPKNIIAVTVAGMAVVGISLAYRYTKLSQPCSSGNCLLLQKAGASDSYSTKTYKDSKTKAGASDSYSTKTYKNTETDEE